MSHNTYAVTHPTVDAAIVIDHEFLLLIERTKPPFLEKLVFPGGHVDAGESCRVACAREVLEEVGLEITLDRLELLALLDEPGRDPRPGHDLSIVFRVNLSREDTNSAKAMTDAKSLHLVRILDLTPDQVGFDHWQAIEKLQKELS